MGQLQTPEELQWISTSKTMRSGHPQGTEHGSAAKDSS